MSSTNKFIEVPKPAEFMGGTYSLKRLVRYLTENEDSFTKTMKGIHAGIRIRALFDKDEPGEIVMVHPEDYAPLKKSAEAPSCGYEVIVGINGFDQRVVVQTAPHIGDLLLALTDRATDKAPEKPVEPEPPRLPPANGATKPEPQHDEDLHAAAV
jgi:hypothetical protein